MNGLIELSDADFLSEGSGRMVFHHPDRPDQLIKVFKTARVKRFEQIRLFFRPSRRRYGSLRVAYSEYEEYIAALERTGLVPDFIARFEGFVQTNRGVGMVVEKILGEDRKAAATLQDYILAHGMSDELYRLIDELFTKLTAARVVTYDLNPSNLLIAHDPRTGTKRLVVVDGIAENTLLRVQTWFDAIYHHSVKQARTKLFASISSLDARHHSAGQGD